MFASEETKRLLAQEAASLEATDYEALRDTYLDIEKSSERIGPDGTPHQLEVVAFWDDKPKGPLRVFVEVTPLRRGWRGGAGTDFIKPVPVEASPRPGN